MPLFTARARPRPTRLSTSSIATIKKRERQMYIYLYLLAVALLLVISVFILQLGLGSSSEFEADDARFAKKGARVAEDGRFNRHKGEFGAEVHQEGYKDTDKLNRRKQAEMFNSGNRLKDSKARNAGGRGVGNGWVEKEEVGSKVKEVPYFSDFEGRAIDMNDMDDLEKQEHTGKSRLYQGQQLDDMDMFDRDEVDEGAYKHQGQLLDDMDKFDNHELTENTNRHMFGDDSVPKVVEQSNRNRKYQMVGKSRVESQVKGSSFMSENDTRGPLQDGKKDPRKLGYMGDNGRDVLNKEREDEEQKGLNKIGRSIGDMLGSEDTVQPAIKRTREAPKGSIRAAIEQHMENRIGVSTREAGDSLRRRFGETNSNLASSHVKNISEKTKHEEIVETGMPPLRGFKEFFDNVKVSHGNDDEPMEKNVIKKNVKSDDAVILGGSSQARRVSPWDIQTTVEDVVVDSLNFPDVKEKKKGAEKSSRSAPETAEINNPDSMKLNALTIEENTSMSSRFDHIVNPKLNVDKEHLESADMLQTDKQPIKEDGLDNVEDIRNEGRKEMEGRNADEDDLVVEDNEVEGEVESGKTNEDDSAVEDNEVEGEVESGKTNEADSAVEDSEVEGEVESEKTNEDDSAVEDNEVEGEVESGKTNEDDSTVEDNVNDSAVENNDDNDYDDLIQWGFYPTLNKKLKFSKFMAAFFKSESCSLRIFMAWTTAPWAFTPRHQRAIESIFYFHPQACIVVFTETIDFKFFDSWVKEGYKIAVARPNLEELLRNTPAIDFAYVWYEWRNMNLFYIHYTELLRISALHKYGGVWLDMDMILARPLPKLHNVLGSTISDRGEWVLNGAFMSFDKSSSFLKACIEEFVATYDETSLGWNGADLLNRVASNSTERGGKVWLEQSEHLQVLEPIAFFPLSRHNIIQYFKAPKNHQERIEQKKLLSSILDKSYGTHVWNSVTGHVVPEDGSLVEKLLNRFCIRCTDVL